MNDFNPLVSIVIPVYNGSNYLREAIDSALSQTYKNIEILVINDGSDDNGKTEYIAKSFENKIRYFYKENGGVSTALNQGIKEMKGEYFSWLSHDDVYYPHKIEKQIEYIRKIANREEAILYSDFDYIDPNSKYIRTKRLKSYNPRRFRYELIVGGPLNGCTTLVPKKCFDTLGLLNEELRTTQDIDFWFRAAGRYDFVRIPQVLAKIRLHLQQGQAIIGSHNRELNDVLIDMIRKVSEKEWMGTTGVSSISAIYARFALGLRWKKCFNASNYALGIAMKNLMRGSPLVILKNCISILISWLLNERILTLLRAASNKYLLLLNKK